MNKPHHSNLPSRSEPQSLITRLTERDLPTGGRRSNPHAALIRDVYLLLNTRRTSLVISPQLSQLAESLLTFGLDDAAGGRAFDSQQLVNDIRETLSRHEPRLRGIEVESLPPTDTDTQLAIRITATVRDDGSPLVLQLSSGALDTSISVEEVAS